MKASTLVKVGKDVPMLIPVAIGPRIELVEIDSYSKACVLFDAEDLADMDIRAEYDDEDGIVVLGVGPHTSPIEVLNSLDAGERVLARVNLFDGTEFVTEIEDRPAFRLKLVEHLDMSDFIYAERGADGWWIVG